MSLLAIRPSRTLKTLFSSALFFGLLGCEKKTADAEVKRIVIGVQPNEAKKDLSAFTSELANRTGLKIEIREPKDYADLVDRFKRGDVDFAFLTALTFLAAEREAGAKALLKKVYGSSEFYYSAIIARTDSKLKDLGGLRGKTIGFVDPKSTSGYLYARVMLREAGLDAGPELKDAAVKHLFCGTHKDCVKALLEKKVDAVAVWSDESSENGRRGAWTDPEFGAEVPKSIQVLKLSEPIPNDAFVVRPDFYEKNPMIVFKVMEALIGMGETPAGPLKQAFDTDKMATATSRHYDSVRALETLLKEGK